jgi:uncharacterized membrane protein YkgB
MTNPNDDFETNYRKWHTQLSYIKSGIRIVAGILALLLLSNIVAAIATLIGGIIIAEVVGIYEERI